MNRRLFSVVVVWACFACTHIPSAREDGADGAPIEEVTLVGVTALDPDMVVEKLANRPPLGFFSKSYVRYDQVANELDRRRIETLYRRRGYFSVRVLGPRVTPAEVPGRVQVEWTVEEGATTRIVEVQLNGAPPQLEDQLGDLVPISVGQTLIHEDYATVKPKLRALLVQRGFAYAAVKGRVEIDRPRSEAKIIYTIDPGPLVHLGEISVQGNVRTPTSAVTNRVTWQPGEVFSPALLEQMRGRLYEIDQYGGVRLDYLDGGATDVANIVARVEEAEQNELQLGVGAGFDRANLQLRLRGRYLRRSFPFPLTNLELEATPQYSILRDFTQGRFTPEARVTWTWSDFAYPRLQLENSIGFTFRQLEAFSWRGPDAGQVLSRPFLDDRLRVGLGWRAYLYNFSSDLQPAAQEELGLKDGDLPVLYLEPAITFDGRDDLLQPRRGVYARIRLEVGFAVRGTGGYTLIAPEVRGYVPIGRRIVLAARARLGATLSGQLPAPRRFFAGGANSQRGFSQRRLSETRPVPRGDGTEEVPIGGETLIETGFEARLLVVRLFGFWLGMAAFIDGADLVTTLPQIDPLRLHWAAGGGVRYYTPIGALRIDVGVRLNRRDAPQPNDTWAWHLTLGEAF